VGAAGVDWACASWATDQSAAIISGHCKLEIFMKTF
jgi:hypothetical protein